MLHDSGSFAEEAKVTDVSVLGIDLGRNSYSVVGLDATGKVVVPTRMRRETAITYAATLPTCVVAMEACCGRITWDVPWRGKAMHYD